MEDPKPLLEEAIRAFVRSSPLNCLTSFGNEPIFEEPLIGYADGDDPIFMEFRKVIREDHFLPREALAKRLAQAGFPETTPSSVSVVALSSIARHETSIAERPGGFPCAGTYTLADRLYRCGKHIVSTW
jgi:hypothetical protein